MKLVEDLNSALTASESATTVHRTMLFYYVSGVVSSITDALSFLVESVEGPTRPHAIDN